MSAAQKNIAINLLTQDDFSSSTIGRILLWALSIGRYIVVFTELIVILSFLSRFKLDRDLTDLNEEIAHQKAIVLAYGDLEPQFRAVQDKLQLVKTKQPTHQPQEILEILRKTLPNDISLTKLTIRPQTFKIEAASLSSDSFITFVKALSAHEDISAVKLGKVESSDEGITIEFALEAVLKEK